MELFGTFIVFIFILVGIVGGGVNYLFCKFFDWIEEKQDMAKTNKNIKKNG